MPYVPQPWSPQKLALRRQAARLAPYEPLLVCAVAVAGGIVLDRYASMGLWWLVIASAFWLAWLTTWRRGRDALSAGALLISLLAVAAYWHHACWRLFPADDLGRFTTSLAQPICLEAVALDSPGRRAAPTPLPYRAIPGGESSRLALAPLRVRDGVSWRTVTGLSRVDVDGHLLGVRAGDRLLVFGKLSRPQAAANPGEFDYAADQRAARRLCLLRCESPDCVTVVQRGGWASVRRVLDSVRGWGEQTLLTRLGPEHGALAAAMIVGVQDRLPRLTVEDFRRAGELHVLVVSGLHVGLVVSGFYFLARMGLAPRRWSLLIVMLAIAGYAMVTGARPPVVRAAVLAELMCVAAWSGRTVLAMNSLGAAAIVVLAMNPADLFRTGPQLSFLAAATLIWFGRRRLEHQANHDAMTRLLRSVESTPKKVIRHVSVWAWLILVATAAVWLVAAPLMMYRFHLLSPVAIPLAVVVFPLVSISVLSGLLVLAAQFALPGLAPLAAAGCAAACTGLDQVVRWADPYCFYVPGPALGWVLAAYALMATGLQWGRRPMLRKAVVYCVLLLVVAGIGPSLARKMTHGSGDSRLRCTFIAVGHGVCALIEPPGGGAVLYDAGSLGSPWLATDRVSGVLWSKGITRLDAVVLSHADVDHFNALPGLLQRFTVGQVITTNQMFPRTLLPDERTAPAELARLLAANKIEVQSLALGDRLQFGQATAQVFHPTAMGVIDSDNANSLVLGVEFAGHRLLLPGDLEGRGLDELLAQEPYDCNILLAPHHGSPRSDPPGLAAWCRPEWVVVSASPGVYSDEANRGYQAAGAQVLSTAESGAVAFVISAAGIAVETYRQQAAPARRCIP